MLRIFLSLIFATSIFGTFSAKAETELWGDFDGVTLRVKLIGGGQYENLYNEVIPWWEENTGGKIEIVTQKNHFELDKEIKKDMLQAIWISALLLITQALLLNMAIFILT